VASPYLLFGATLDASGSFHAHVDIPAALVGLRFATQAVLLDPIFGPLTGSNAIAVRLVP
jgi:hypothetical protein